MLSNIWKNAVEEDGIIRAATTNTTPKVTEVTPLDDFTILLYFTDGHHKIFDVKPLLDSPAFQPLKDIEVFKKVVLEDGIISWCEYSIDIAPETLYEQGVLVAS